MNLYKEYAKKLKEVFEENSMALCQLDANAGDGDHGITISRGFSRGYEKVSSLDDDVSPSEVFKTIGYSMLETMGGASGPIFSTFFVCMATVLRETEVFDANAIKKGIEETTLAINDLAGTKRGEKTMADSLYYALDEVKSCGNDLKEVLTALEIGAEKGSIATIDMVATKGRAKFMGERSRGFMDAGSRSVYLIMKAMKDTFC